MTGLIVLLFSVAGVVLNNRMLRAGFILWLVSNALSAVLHAQAGMWWLLVRDVVFFVLAIEGYWKWGKDARYKRDN